MKPIESRQITLRVSRPLYETVKRVAKRRRISLNRLAQEGLEQVARQELAAQMRGAYEELGADGLHSEIEEFLPAQGEVVLSGPD